MIGQWYILCTYLDIWWNWCLALCSIISSLMLKLIAWGLGLEIQGREGGGLVRVWFVLLWQQLPFLFSIPTWLESITQLDFCDWPGGVDLGLVCWDVGGSAYQAFPANSITWPPPVRPRPGRRGGHSDTFQNSKFSIERILISRVIAWWCWYQIFCSEEFGTFNFCSDFLGT